MIYKLIKSKYTKKSNKQSINMTSILSFFFCCSKNNIAKEQTNPKSFEEKLKNIGDLEKFPLFSLKGKSFIAKPTNIYDGDTLSMIFEVNGEILKYRCRCMGYDSPEMKPSKSKPDRELEISLAKKAKQRFVELLEKHQSKLVKIECFEFDKYGRLLVNIYNKVDEKSINQIMIDEKHGKAYDGGTKDCNWSDI